MLTYHAGGANYSLMNSRKFITWTVKSQQKTKFVFRQKSEADFRFALCYFAYWGGTMVFLRPTRWETIVRSKLRQQPKGSRTKPAARLSFKIMPA